MMMSSSSAHSPHTSAPCILLARVLPLSLVINMAGPYEREEEREGEREPATTTS